MLHEYWFQYLIKPFISSLKFYYHRTRCRQRMGLAFQWEFATLAQILTITKTLSLKFKALPYTSIWITSLSWEFGLWGIWLKVCGSCQSLPTGWRSACRRQTVLYCRVIIEILVPVRSHLAGIVIWSGFYVIRKW